MQTRPYVRTCVCVRVRVLLRVLLYIFGCVPVCVSVRESGVCRDSCSLNSIIVSNWGLPSQCRVVGSILSWLLTVAQVQYAEHGGMRRSTT